MHICVGKLTIIGSDNGLSPERRQAIIWTNAGILLIGPLGTNFSGILIEIQTLSLKRIRLKMSSAKCCSFRLGLNVLNSVVASANGEGYVVYHCWLVWLFVCLLVSNITNKCKRMFMKFSVWVGLGTRKNLWHYRLTPWIQDRFFYFLDFLDKKCRNFSKLRQARKYTFISRHIYKITKFQEVAKHQFSGVCMEYRHNL